MDTEMMIRNLKKVEEDHKDDKVFTGQLNIAEMAHDARKRLEELKPYGDTGLTPEQIVELSESVKKLQEHFGDAITADQVIDFFVDFYIAQGDPERTEGALLLTNEAVTEYRELKERDMPKKIDLNAGVPICPVCGRRVVRCYDFCPDCGQRLEQ